jgi:hypothetical protein
VLAPNSPNPAPQQTAPCAESEFERLHGRSLGLALPAGETVFPANHAQYPHGVCLQTGHSRPVSLSAGNAPRSAARPAWLSLPDGRQPSGRANVDVSFFIVLCRSSVAHRRVPAG